MSLYEEGQYIQLKFNDKYWLLLDGGFFKTIVSSIMQ
jgi:hypothetical protein